ncbi:MAG TPA: DUF5665 domain-containing protein [Candidatus Saccharimonadales bacterium]|jgi:hypothetical protein
MKLGTRPKQSARFTPQDYTRLGKQVVELYAELQLNRKVLYRTSFIKGILSGLGGVIGATIGVALLLWLLSLFGQVPFIGHFVESVKHTLQNRPK